MNELFSTYKSVEPLQIEKSEKDTNKIVVE